ncbi:hypothetical protein [Dyadobacter sandarakinus]|uniref:Uncharacterized protein n=1 Tax=Dyadobacter sandarakinus TaxID=2747268 RepID=A0ABX7I2N3_9BACT|nr:hypothetical protein [Dyadobacter sandarakinus]QRQ99492.1 hypothetical protein HWI92_00475 [Dyadobacter sandarakinus]
MLKIEIKEHQRNIDEPSSLTKILVVNSIEDVYSYYSEHRKHRSGRLSDENVIEELFKYTPKQIRLFLDEITFSIDLSTEQVFYADISILCRAKENEPSLTASVIFQTDFVNWNKPYSIAEMAEEISLIITSDNNPMYKYFEYDDEIITNGFGFVLGYINEDSTIFELETEIQEYIENLIDRAISSISNRLYPDVLLTSFIFPEPIKTSCKQYLVYFAQFLADLGVDASTEIKEDAHGTLFKIIPKDKDASLEQIRDALSIYLNAPTADNLVLIQKETNYDISVMQWQANILHLQSHLLITNSLLQLKDATIEQLKLSNYQYENMIKARPAIENVKEGGEEEVIKGVLSVTKYEGQGFSINLPEILRIMKRKLFRESNA